MIPVLESMSGSSTSNSSLICSLLPSSARLRTRRHVSIPPSARRNSTGMPCNCKIQIDHRKHFEESLRRQQEQEEHAAIRLTSCPVECVREVRTLDELEAELKQAEDAMELVMVDFYTTVCGACRYMLPQVVKMCKRGCGEGCVVEGEQGAIRYLTHNVRDEYDELSDIANFYKIKHVPRFVFFMDGCQVEQYSTRDPHRLAETLSTLLARYHELTASK